MKGKLISASVMLILTLLLVSCEGCVFYRYHSTACKERGAQYASRIEKLKKDAREELKIGTKKEDIIRFFKENGLPVDFIELPYGHYEASGTIRTVGCAPSGCGSDDGLLGLRVEVDKAGTVIAKPRVGAMYTNCM